MLGLLLKGLVEKILTNFICLDRISLIDKNGLRGRQTLHDLVEFDLAEIVHITRFLYQDFFELLILVKCLVCDVQRLLDRVLQPLFSSDDFGPVHNSGGNGGAETECLEGFSDLERRCVLLFSHQQIVDSDYVLATPFMRSESSSSPQ